MERHRCYILDSSGEPARSFDPVAFGIFIDDHARLNVADDAVGDTEILTVFLAVDHGTEPEAPVLWETTIFRTGATMVFNRYGSRAEAVAGHALAVKLERASQAEKKS